MFAALLTLPVICALTAGTTLYNGGSVLIPSYSSGIVYDLFAFVVRHLRQLKFNKVPIYFVSPTASKSLAFSNIFSNW